MPSYTAGFKSRMVQRMAGAEGISAYALSTEVGVSQASLSRWLRDAPTVGVMSKKRMQSGGRSPRRTAGDKFRIVLEASALSGDELGAFMRKEGIHSTQLEQWHSAAQAAAEGALKSTHAKASERTPEARRIKELERDLHRKNKALAEVTALLALKKRVQEIWGDEDDNTPTRSGT